MKLFIATSPVLLAVAYIVTQLSIHLTPLETLGLFITLSCSSLLFVINSDFVEADK